MTKDRSGQRSELGRLLPSAEDIEIFRERMLEHIADLNLHPPLPDEVCKRLVERNACSVLLPALTTALRAHGYTGRMTSLSDAQHTIEFYDGPIYDPHGAALADAIFVAMTFTDPHWSMENPSEYLWRLCYRLGQLAALERDNRRETDKQKTMRATAAKTAGGWERRAALAYAAHNSRLGTGRMKSKAALAREIYRHLWDRSQAGGGRFTRPSAGRDADGYPIPTEAALRTIQGWFKPAYDAQT